MKAYIQVGINAHRVAGVGQGSKVNYLYFLIAGQSNAVGVGLIQGGEEPSNNVYMFGNDYKFKVASEPVDNYVNQVDSVSADANAGHGFSLKAAKDIAEAVGEKVLIIPCAKGSTQIDQWLPGDDVDDRNTLFGSMNWRRKTATGGNITALWWFGHESSAFELGNLYSQLWTTLVTRLRRTFNKPIIYAQLAKHQTFSFNNDQNRAALQQATLETGYSSQPLVLGNVKYNHDFRTHPFIDGVPQYWTKYNVTETTYFEQTTEGLRVISDGSVLLGMYNATQLLNNGGKYLLEIEIAKVVEGYVTSYTGVKINTHHRPLIWKEVFTASGTVFYIYARGTTYPTDVIIRSIKISEYISGDIWQPLEDHHMVVTFDLPLIDIVHLDQQAQIEVGRRFALATRQHVLGESVNGTGPRLASSNAFTHPSADKSKVKITFDKAINDGSATNYDNQFRVYDGGVEMTITSVVRDADGVSVLITMSTTATGTVTVSYGDVPAAGNGIWLTDVVKDSDNLPAPQFSLQTVV